MGLWVRLGKGSFNSTRQKSKSLDSVQTFAEANKMNLSLHYRVLISLTPTPPVTPGVCWCCDCSPGQDVCALLSALVTVINLVIIRISWYWFKVGNNLVTTNSNYPALNILYLYLSPPIFWHFQRSPVVITELSSGDSRDGRWNS